MKPKKIAITQRIVETHEYVELRDALSHDWIIYLQQCGYVPLLIPSNIDDVASYIQMFGCDGVILSNGESVRLAKNNSGQWTGSVRDVTEAKLLDWAIENDTPVLGICRGMHFINCYFGGNLIGNIKGHVTKAHDIHITDDYFQRFYNTEMIRVNSYHRIGIPAEHVGKGLLTWAMRENIVEGFIHKQYRVLGLEWHPEREKSYSFKDKLLIEKFFNKEIQINLGSVHD